MPTMYINDADVITGETPAHTYSQTTRFEDILRDIDRNLIPTNTGQVFPTVWDSDFNEGNVNSLFGEKNQWL